NAVSQPVPPGFAKVQRGGRYRWRIRAVDKAAAVLGNGAYPPLVRHLLWGRGVRTDLEALRFLDEATGPSVAVTHDPFLLPDMDRAVARLKSARAQGELVAAWGDFDVDGVTSCALLLEGLGGLGFHVIAYIPDRFTEGYGLNQEGIAALRRKGVSVIVTADCGTSNVAEVAYARELGMDVIVVDHHTTPPLLPDAHAIVNPKVPDSPYPCAELAACGVVFKLLQALYDACGRQFVEEDYIDLVALGTVVDMAPLQDENRDIVRRGLRELRRSRRPGVRALMDVAGVAPEGVSARDLGFGLGPRLNAAGRLAHARQALELLLAQDEGHAHELAMELNALNLERRRQTEEAVTLARQIVTARDELAPLVFVGDRSFPSGVVGLVASRLVEELHRPAIVFQEGELESRASARSIPVFDIVSALRPHADLMVRFGGHRQAAGFTVENVHREALRAALERGASELLSAADLEPTIDIDAAVPLGRLRGEDIRYIGKFAPFGIGNPEITLLSRGAEVLECRPVGGDGEHLRLKLRDQGITWPAIAFRQAASGLEPGTRADVVYSLTPDIGPAGLLQLTVRDFALSSA
ncbi:MAG TPA: single-stranded-DNA-specific exonuclease RecJ, partial [Dehalococcoidia bacterium]|nr:single-stranded-DNA-specific exonuclease RecJ [Dehalococcoidia bacterium]